MVREHAVKAIHCNGCDKELCPGSVLIAVKINRCVFVGTNAKTIWSSAEEHESVWHYCGDCVVLGRLNLATGELEKPA